MPPAPGMLTTWELFVIPFVRIACCISRMNVSQPPPAPAGAMSVTFERASRPTLAEANEK